MHDVFFVGQKRDRGNGKTAARAIEPRAPRWSRPSRARAPSRAPAQIMNAPGLSSAGVGGWDT